MPVECRECDEYIWICQEEGTPDCSDLPGGNLIPLSKTPCPGGWCYVGCEEYAPADYTVWFRPGTPGGKCEAVLRVEADGAPAGSGWQKLGTKNLAGRFKLWCKRGGAGGEPFKVAVKAVISCS